PVGGVRCGKDAAADSSAAPASGQVRPRSSQPGDGFGRFRKAGRDDDFALGGDRAAAAGPDGGADAADAAAGLPGRLGRLGHGRRGYGRPRSGDYSWSDFELDDDRPRVEPYPPGTPHAADG